MDPAFLQKLFADSRKMRKGSDTTAYEAFMGFYHAVRWRDPGVLALLGFHVVFALTCLLVRRHPNAHIAMFLLACGLCYSATHLNALLAVHWRDCGFSQNYFDKHGVFMSSLFCAPLLLVVFAQMVRLRWRPPAGPPGCPPPHTHPTRPHALLQLYSLAVSCDLLVKVKRAELRQHLRDKRKAEAAEGADASAPKPDAAKKLE